MARKLEFWLLTPEDPEHDRDYHIVDTREEAEKLDPEMEMECGGYSVELTREGVKRALNQAFYDGVDFGKAVVGHEPGDGFRDD